MSYRSLRRQIIWVIVAYALVIGIGLLLVAGGSPTGGGSTAAGERAPSQWLDVYKAVTPLLIAMPSSWLVYCFQRRLSYLQSLRLLWSCITSAVQDAIQYTHKKTPPDHGEFGRVMMRLSIAIDEVRAVFKNIGEVDGRIGLYPFEPIKKIHQEILELGWAANGWDPDRAEAARNKIVSYWGQIREPILSEFDRDYASKPHSPYVSPQENPTSAGTTA